MSKLSIGRAWEETASFLKHETRLVLPIALATFAIPSALATWANPGGERVSQSGIGTILTFLVLVAALIGQMAIAGLASGRRESVGEILRLSFRRVWGLFASYLILFAPIVLVAMLILGTLLSSRGLTDPASVTPEALAEIPAVGAILLAILLIFVVIAIRMFPGAAIAINETSRPMTLIRRNWQITKGNSLRLLGVVVGIFLAALVLGLAATAVIGSVLTLVSGAPEPFSLSALLLGLASGAVSAAVTATAAALVGRIYVQLADRPAA